MLNSCTPTTFPNNFALWLEAVVLATFHRLWIPTFLIFLKTLLKGREIFPCRFENSVHFHLYNNLFLWPFFDVLVMVCVNFDVRSVREVGSSCYLEWNFGIVCTPFVKVLECNHVTVVDCLRTVSTIAATSFHCKECVFYRNRRFKKKGDCWRRYVAVREASRIRPKRFAPEADHWQGDESW